MTMTDAYKYVRSRRPVVSPNLNFMGQLLEFERDLNSGVTPRILMPKLNGVETQVWPRSKVEKVHCTALLKARYDEKSNSTSCKMVACSVNRALLILWKWLDGHITDNVIMFPLYGFYDNVPLFYILSLGLILFVSRLHASQVHAKGKHGKSLPAMSYFLHKTQRTFRSHVATESHRKALYCPSAPACFLFIWWLTLITKTQWFTTFTVWSMEV